MGKEQDLIDAGRTGNLAVIEKTFGQKSKKSPALVNQITGAFASLRRLPNINCQDANGDTPLHLAALNGHREVVRALLQYDASASPVDNRGCLPIHLAAWNGHHDICHDLLALGPSVSKTDEQNYEGETALLCAAQYGHTPVVNVLLTHRADSRIRNHRGESPLDLACQYGRLDTVRLLLAKCPHLVSDSNEASSALHLAARNGHLSIVQLLVQCGFNINSLTETGSALHEAAVYGKEDVVQYLLTQGVDVYLKDSNDRTALEVLSDQKSQKSLNIGTAILDHFDRLGLSPTKPRPASTLMYDPAAPRPVSEMYARPVKVDKPCSHRDKESVTSECSTTSSVLGSSPPLPERHYSRPVSDPIYDVPLGKPMPIPQGRSPALSEGSLSSPQGSPASYGTSPSRSPNIKHDIPKKPPRKRKTVRTPPHVVTASNTAEITSHGANNSFDSITSDSPSSILPEITEHNKETTNQVADTADHVVSSSNDGLDQLGHVAQSTNRDRSDELVTCGVSGHVMRIPATVTISGVKNDHSIQSTDTKPKESDRNFDIKSEVSHNLRGAVNVGVTDRDGENSSSFQEPNPSADTVNKGLGKPVVPRRPDRSKTVAANSMPTAETEQSEARTEEVPRSQCGRSEAGTCEQPPVVSSQTSRPCCLQFGADGHSKSSKELPLSPSGYQQPPTPDFPPPSPATAQAGIHDKIDPIIAHEKRRSRELDSNKRRSRDIETITENIYLSQNSADSHLVNSPIIESPNTSSPQHHVCVDKRPPVSVDSQHMPPVHKGFAHIPALLESEYITVALPSTITQTETQRQGDLELKGGRSNSSILRHKKGQGQNEELLFSDGEDPFVGLTKGAIPMGERRIKSQIYDSLIVHPIAKLKKRLSTPGYDARALEKQERTCRENEGMDTKIGSQTSSMHQSDKCDSQSCVNSLDPSDAAQSKGVSKTADNSKSFPASNGSLHSKQNGSVSEALEAAGKEKPFEGDTHTESRELRDVSRRPLTSRDPSRGSAALEEDETEEWAQIAGIMASFGGSIARESVFVKDYEEKFTQMLSESVGMQSVGDWLDTLGLPQYENILIPNGFDDMEFMGPDVLEYNDLIQMGIADKQHIRIILEACSKLPSLKYIGNAPVPASVTEWLESLQLSDYVTSFQESGYTSIGQLRHVWELELHSVMDSISLGHRKRILASLRHPRTPSSTEDENIPITPHRASKQRYVNVQGPEDEDSVFKDYTITASSSANQGEEDGSNLDIRPPAVHSAIKQWRHRPEVLVKGCCKYVAQYLGSKEVKNLMGLESTKESISKMKISTRGMAKVPSIILSISYKGVKFIDGKSKRVVCEHEISNIFCACQDGDHLNYFAYITKDLQSHMYYCHVFSVSSTELATEIILTLGEAFEVAYQMAIREQGAHSHNAPVTRKSRAALKADESRA